MFTVDRKNMIGTADRKDMLQEVYLFMFTVEAVLLCLLGRSSYLGTTK